MHIQSILLLSVTLLLSACSVNKSAKSNKEIITELDQTTGYVNPVVGRSLPDPTVIKASDGNFYLYATEDIRNLPIYKSSNLTDWEFVATAFTDETRPDFEPKGGLWAPDINFINGK